DEQEGEEEEEGYHLQPLEEQDAEGIERLVFGVVTEAVHVALARGRTPRKPRSGWWRARTIAGSLCRACNTGFERGSSRSTRSMSCTSRPPCRRSSDPWRCAQTRGRLHRGRRSALAS